MALYYPICLLWVVDHRSFLPSFQLPATSVTVRRFRDNILTEIKLLERKFLDRDTCVGAYAYTRIYAKRKNAYIRAYIRTRNARK